MTSSKPIKRGRGRPSKITRAQILLEARKMPASELTMPALANILSVKTPALYHHFESREHLVRTIGQQVFDEMSIPEPDSLNWRQWLHSANMALYRFILEHPLLLEIGHSAQGYLSMTLQLCEASLETLQEAGFDRQRSYWITLSLTQLATAAARSQLQGDTTEAVHDNVSSHASDSLNSRPRAAELISSLSEKSNEDWLAELLQWSIDCTPDPPS